MAGEDPVDGHAGGTDRRPDLSRLFPALRIEIALGGAVVERELCGIVGPRRECVAQHGDDAGLGQAGTVRPKRAIHACGIDPLLLMVPVASPSAMRAPVALESASFMVSLGVVTLTTV